MLFLKELRKVCVSFVYLLFLALLLFSWRKNFYGITEKEIAAAKGGGSSVSEAVGGGSILEKPEEKDSSYGTKKAEVPEKIMRGGTDWLIIEYLKNSYAAYPFGYYKEVVLSEEEQARVLEIIREITGLTEEQIHNLPDGYFPPVNGNIVHMGEAASQQEDGSFIIKPGESGSMSEGSDSSVQFESQVSYERFKELMAEMEAMVGKGSYYSMEMLLEYYGQEEMTYEEAVTEYDKTITEDRISTAFARLFCDYMTRILGLYPVFLAVVCWLRDRRSRMNELIDCRPIGTGKLLLTRFLAILTAVMVPVILLSFESLIPLMRYSAETGIAIDRLAFLKYSVWWLLPTAMAVTSLGMFLTILTSSPLAVLVQFVWWFLDSSAAPLSGGTNLCTLMIRHNLLNGSELIQQNLTVICLNRGLLVLLSLVLIWLSALLYNKKRGGGLTYGCSMQKHVGIFKDRFLAHIQK